MAEDKFSFPDFNMLENIKSNYTKKKSNDRRGSLFQQFDPLFKMDSPNIEKRRSVDSLTIDITNTSLDKSAPRKAKKWDNESFLIESTPLRPTQIQTQSTDAIPKPFLQFNKDIIGDLPLLDISSPSMSPIQKSNNAGLSSTLINTSKRFKSASSNSEESLKASPAPKSEKTHVIDSNLTLNQDNTSTEHAPDSDIGGLTIILPSQTNPSILQNSNKEAAASPTLKSDYKDMHDNLKEDTDKKLGEIQAENSRFRNVIVLYEMLMKKIEPFIEKINEERSIESQTLIKEKTQLIEDQKALENSFSELHRRFERLRASTKDQAENEAKLVQSNQEYRDGLKLAGTRITELIEENEKSKLTYTQEIERLEATLKVEQIKISGLEKNIQDLSMQKIELTKICEELLSKAT